MSSTIAMLATAYEKKRITSWPVYVEPKLDGIRTLICCEPDGSVRFITRNGNKLPSLMHLAYRFKDVGLRYGSLILDGEAEVNGEAFHEGAGKIRRIHEMANGAIITLFDIQTVGDCTRRRSVLERIYKEDVNTEHDCVGGVMLVDRYEGEDFGHIDYLYDCCRSDGYEGAMIKIPASEYMFRRHWSWMKIKAVETHDVRIVGTVEGQGKYVGSLGALVCETFDSSDQVSGTVKVGGGFDDSLRQLLWDTRETICGLYIEVECQEKSHKGSLRHPRFLRFRPDK